MLLPTLNRELVREVDRRAVEEYGMSSLVLMENAGRGVAEKLLELQLPGPFLICCGKGNNAGDGFVIARHLDLHLQPVEVLVWSTAEELSPDAAANFRVLARSGVPCELLGSGADRERLRDKLSAAGTVVDALLGTGARGAPRPPLDWVIGELSGAGKPIVAVDLPSGLDCDTGQTLGPAIRAQHTCTFVAMKPGFLAPGAAEFTGQVHVVSIGAPRRLVEELLRAAEQSPGAPGR